MANILILGASSQIGHEIALKFAPKNTLYLSGRNNSSLDLIANKCLKNGAEKVSVICSDLSYGSDQLFELLGNSPINLIINLISATSRIRDSNFPPQIFDTYIQSDLLAPIQLVRKISKNLDKHPDVIFISSILASIKSPEKEIYSSLKKLQELYWETLFRQDHGGSLLIVKVGKRIPHINSNYKAKKLANKIFESYQSKVNVINYGWEGKVYSLLFHLQPLLLQLLIKAQRVFRAQ